MRIPISTVFGTRAALPLNLILPDLSVLHGVSDTEVMR